MNQITELMVPQCNWVVSYITRNFFGMEISDELKLNEHNIGKAFQGIVGPILEQCFILVFRL
jgi:hypothetical protein